MPYIQQEERPKYDSLIEEIINELTKQPREKIKGHHKLLDSPRPQKETLRRELSIKRAKDA